MTSHDTAAATDNIDVMARETIAASTTEGSERRKLAAETERKALQLTKMRQQIREKQLAQQRQVCVCVCVFVGKPIVFYCVVVMSKIVKLLSSPSLDAATRETLTAQLQKLAKELEEG